MNRDTRYQSSVFMSADMGPDTVQQINRLMHQHTKDVPFQKPVIGRTIAPIQACP